MASAAPDWTSLPPELINRIAGCFLATNDVDHYMDFRAVCTNWRSATDDTKNPLDVRFHPRLWVIIDEVFQSDARLLVNTATGRAVRKDLPLLRNYYVMATTTPGGSIVVADGEYPHTLSLLNPFTGGMIRFAASMPAEMHITAAVDYYYDSSSPTLFLFSDIRPTMYKTDPERECSTVFEDKLWYHMIRLAVKGGMMCTDGDDQAPATEPLSLPVPKILDLMKRYVVDPAVMCSDSCFLVKSDGKKLIILKLRHCVEIFKIDEDVVEPVESIGNYTIFIGYHRCLSVRADKFPSIKANCIYYTKSLVDYSSSEIYLYDLRKRKKRRSHQELFIRWCRSHSWNFLLSQSLSSSAATPPTYENLSALKIGFLTFISILIFDPGLHQSDD